MSTLSESLESRMEPLTGHLLVGLSGGADSVALLRLLLVRRERGELTVTACHVNHGMRGDASDGDEEFCRQLCAQWNVPLIVCRLSLQADASEDEARRARYGCFHRAAREAGTRTLVLAHHRDDQAETFMMRLMRGSGSSGLSAMKPVSVTSEGLAVCRPMLSFSRKEIREMLREIGQDWHEDESNASPSCLRNRVRNELLPMMASLVPGAEERIAKAAALLRIDDQALSAYAEAFLEKHSTGFCLHLKGFGDLPEAVQNRALRRWWEQQAPERSEHTLSAEETAALRKLTSAPDGTSINLPGGLQIAKGTAFLHLRRIAPAEQTDRPELSGIRLEPCETGTPGAVCISRRKLEASAIRVRQPGDRIRFEEQERPCLLKDWMRDQAIEEPFRSRIPLLAQGNDILMVCGYQPFNTEPNADDGVWVRWNCETPWTWETAEDRI